MSEVNTTKKYPSAPPEVSDLLGMNKSTKSHVSEHADAHKESITPGNLPVIDAASTHETHSTHSEHTTEVKKHSVHGQEHGDLEAKVPTWKKVLKTAAPYFAVFAMGLVLYYFFLSNTNFSSILSRLKPTQQIVRSPKETALEQLQKQNMKAYIAWIGQYYFDVSDASVIDPNTDNSGNGLSNFHKYLLNLNPRSYDSLSLGMADSQALAQGINPATGGKLEGKQKEIVDKYFDMEVIMNRLALNNLSGSRNVAGSSTSNSNQNNSVGSGSSFGGNSNTTNLNNNQSNSNSTNNQINQININNGKVNARGGSVAGVSNYVVPQTGADISGAYGFVDGSNIDQTRPGLLEVPSLNIKAPIIWTQNPKSFDKDLQSGVVHFPGTAMPGQVGTTYISGHSSNVPWAKGDYNKVFSTLGSLSDNASFNITVYTKEGKTIKYHYVVSGRKEFLATDPEQFKNTAESVVALSTCWPVNTTQKRLVVFGVLTQTER